MNKKDFEKEVDVIENTLHEIEHLQVDCQTIIDSLRGEKLTKKQKEVLEELEIEIMF